MNIPQKLVRAITFNKFPLFVPSPDLALVARKRFMMSLIELLMEPYARTPGDFQPRQNHVPVPEENLRRAWEKPLSSFWQFYAIPPMFHDEIF